MLDEKLVELLNDQVNKEFYSAYLYLSMANYYNEEGLSGFGNWFTIQAQEERDHRHPEPGLRVRHATVPARHAHDDHRPVRSGREVLSAVRHQDGQRQCGHPHAGQRCGDEHQVRCHRQRCRHAAQHQSGGRHRLQGSVHHRRLRQSLQHRSGHPRRQRRRPCGLMQPKPLTP